MSLDGIPCCAKTCLMKTYASSSAVISFFTGKKYAYFVSLSKITYMVSYCIPVVGSVDIGSGPTKSIVTSSHAPEGG